MKLKPSSGYLSKYLKYTFRNGFKVTNSILSARQHLNPLSEFNENLWHVMESLEPQQNLTFPQLGATLELIATKGADGMFILYKKVFLHLQETFIFLFMFFIK